MSQGYEASRPLAGLLPGGGAFPGTSFSLEWELGHFRGLWLLPHGFQSFRVRSKVGLCPLLSGEDLRLG